MKVIGITGGIGAGKSEILAFLEKEYGACVIQADEVGHLVMEPGTAAYEEVLKRFGPEILRQDKTIDRKILGGIVFADLEKLKALSAVIHPAVKAFIRSEIARQEKKGDCRLLIIEAALLIEDHYEEICDEFWYIYAEPEVRRQRLKSSRGYSDEKVTSVFDSQQPDQVFRRHCQAVIDNSGLREEAQEQIQKLIESRGWNL